LDFPAAFLQKKCHPIPVNVEIGCSQSSRSSFLFRSELDHKRSQLAYHGATSPENLTGLGSCQILPGHSVTEIRGCRGCVILNHYPPDHLSQIPLIRGYYFGTET
jgi:hypothetical protein